MIERALPGQILVGDFRAEMQAAADRASGAVRSIDSVDFVDLAMRTVEQLAGLELSGERVDAIRCYLDRAEAQHRRVLRAAHNVQ